MNCTPHAGHQRGAGKVDHPGTGGCGHVRAQCRDPVAIDEDLPACVRARIDAVEHLRGAEEERVGRRRGMAAARTAISAVVSRNERIFPNFALTRAPAGPRSISRSRRR